jgi:cell division transport system permease protein
MSSYTIRAAIAGMWREKWVNALCALTIATGLLLMALSYTFTYNVGLATRRLPDRFSVSVFLEDGLSADALDGIMKSTRRSPAVKAVRYISKDEALAELRTTMSGADYILEGLEENPLPASLEIKLKEGAVTWASVEGLASELNGIKGISEVQYGKKFLSALQSLKKNSEAVAVVLISVLSAGVVFVCYSTVKLLFYRKKDEIETLKFLGATRWFIRAPFLIEGGIIGLASGMAALAAAVSLRLLVYDRLAEYMPVLKVLSIPAGLVLYMPLAGLLIGVAGAALAIGRIRF